jgi:acetyl esterase/lipase
MGDRKVMGPRCEALAARGFTAIAVEYRSTVEAPWPAQLHDVKAAVRWANDNAAELGIERVVLQGHSAGAHLALIAAGAAGRPDLDPDSDSAPTGPIAAVVAYYPLVRLDPDMAMPDLAELNLGTLAAMRGPDGSVPAAMLLGPEATPDAATAASPIEYVTEQFPPTILFHGTADSVVAGEASIAFREALDASGVAAEVHLLAGVDHEFDATPSLTDPCVATVDSFLSRLVFDPEGFREEEAATNPIVAMRRAMQA